MNKALTTKKKVGRPMFDGKDKWLVCAKLARAFAVGANIKQASAFAGISRYSYYRFAKKYPEFRNRLELLREYPAIFAKQTVVQNLDKIEVAKWYLTKTCPEEFSGNEVLRRKNRRLKERIKELKSQK